MLVFVCVYVSVNIQYGAALACNNLLTSFYTLISIVHLPCHPPLPLCQPPLLLNSPLYSSSSLSLAPASMQEWEVLLGDRLAPSFQEAECRPRLSGCKRKKEKKEKTVLEGKKGQVSFPLAWEPHLFNPPPSLLYPLIYCTLHPEVVQK